MKGVSVESVKVLERGFENDRRYMLVDEEGTFISQRTHPELTFFEPRIDNKDLVVNYKKQTFSTSLSTSLNQTIQVTIFEHTLSATEVSEESNEWFSSILNQNVRLVKMCKKDVRYKKLIKGPEEVEVSFADGYPYLILGSASMNNLNDRLEDAVNINRFRANIIVKTDTPHIEDTWDDIVIGNARFLVVKPCARCQVVTIDQNSGELSKEPLKTLSTYRRKENKVYFGANAISRRDGYVHVDDQVVIL